jgi:hypothetical protein
MPYKCTRNHVPPLSAKLHCKDGSLRCGGKAATALTLQELALKVEELQAKLKRINPLCPTDLLPSLIAAKHLGENIPSSPSEEAGEGKETFNCELESKRDIEAVPQQDHAVQRIPWAQLLRCQPVSLPQAESGEIEAAKTSIERDTHISVPSRSSKDTEPSNCTVTIVRSHTDPLYTCLCTLNLWNCFVSVSKEQVSQANGTDTCGSNISSCPSVSHIVSNTSNQVQLTQVRLPHTL